MSFKKLAEIIKKEIKEHSNLIAEKRGDQPWKKEDNFNKKYILDPSTVEHVVITYDGIQLIASPPNIPHHTLTAETGQDIEEFLNEYKLLKWELPKEKDENFMKTQLIEFWKKQGITSEVMKRIIYKHLVDVDPEFAEKRLKEQREAFYKAALRELSEKEARALADVAFWWID